MKRFTLLLPFLAFFAINSAFSQAKINVDSLLKVAEKYTKEDTTKINMLLEIGELYSSKNPVKGLEVADKALSLAQRINQPFFEALSYYCKSRCFLNLGESKKTIEESLKAVSIFESFGKTNSLGYCLDLLAFAHFNCTKYEEGLKYTEKAMAVFETLNNKKGIASCLKRRGIYYAQMHNHALAVENMEKALKIVKEIGKKAAIRDHLYNLGILYTFLSDYPKALECFQQLLPLEKEEDIQGFTPFVYTEIGYVYYVIHDYDKAIEYYNKALKLAEQVGNKKLILRLTSYKADYYRDLSNYEQALENDVKGFSIAEQLSDSSDITWGLIYLANDYLELKNYSKALNCGKKALELLKKIELDDPDIYRYLGDIYLNAPDNVLKAEGINPNERFTKTEEFYLKGITTAKESKSKISLQKTLKSASSFYEKTGDYIKAYQLFSEHIAIKDSISGDDVKKQVTRKEIEYEYDKKETALKYEQQLTTEQLEKQKLLTFQQGQTLTLKEQALALSSKDLLLSNKEKDLVHLAYLKEQAEKQEKTQQLSLSEEREKGKEKDLNLKNLELSAQQKQNLYLGLFSVLLLGGLGALSYFYTTLKKQKNIIAQQNELNEQTIAILSHDIKEPLLGVKLLLKKLNKEDAFVAQASDSLEKQINSVNGILNNLLKMKKLSFAKKDKNAKANVNTVVQNVIQELGVAIHGKALTINNEISEDFTVPISQEKLQIIVNNLLSNAVKYSFPNQSIRIYQEGNGFLIQDFGIGLSPEQRSKIMREVTASQQGTSKERGNGLGLFLVGTLLQGEQLKVIFDSPEIGGTIVKIWG